MLAAISCCTKRSGSAAIAPCGKRSPVSTLQAARWPEESRQNRFRSVKCKLPVCSFANSLEHAASICAMGLRNRRLRRTPAVQDTLLRQRETTASVASVRTDWTREEIAALFDLPFPELVFRAAEVHRQHHRAGEVQLCTLLSIKTGGCPEDCGYCSQSVKADSGVEATKLMGVQAVLQSAAQARDAGSKRFCMGAAWRNPKDRDMPAIVEIVKGVRAMGLETCMTLGMLTPKQADMLAEAVLDYYNHNIDSSPEYYERVITTRTMADRLDTLANVRAAGINVCSGGIVGMG